MSRWPWVLTFWLGALLSGLFFGALVASVESHPLSALVLAVGLGTMLALTAGVWSNIGPSSPSHRPTSSSSPVSLEAGQWEYQGTVTVSQVWPLGSADTEAPVPEATKAVYTRPLDPRLVKEIGEDGPSLSAAADALFASLSSTGAPAPTDESSTCTETRSVDWPIRVEAC